MNSNVECHLHGLEANALLNNQNALKPKPISCFLNMSENIKGDYYSSTLEPTVFFLSVLSVICLIQMHFSTDYGNIFSELQVNTRQDRYIL